MTYTLEEIKDAIYKELCGGTETWNQPSKASKNRFYATWGIVYTALQAKEKETDNG